MSTEKIKSKTKVTPSRFFKSEMKVTRNGVVLELPEDILEHLKMNKADKSEVQLANCIIINGVLQVSHIDDPKVEIPVISLAEFNTPVNNSQTPISADEDEE